MARASRPVPVSAASTTVSAPSQAAAGSPAAWTGRADSNRTQPPAAPNAWNIAPTARWCSLFRIVPPERVTPAAAATARGAELFHGCSAAWARLPMNTYACAVRRARRPPTMPARTASRRIDTRRFPEGEPLDGTQTSPVVLADLEHVLRLPGHPVRIRPAERQRQPHLPDLGC